MRPFSRLLHVGNVVVDVVLAVPGLPGRGEDVLAARAQTVAGGGFNVMAAAARQGLTVAYGGAHGSGPFGALARAACAREGIGLVQPAKPGLDTGIVISIVEPDGERTFITSPGAEAMLTAEDLRPVRAGPHDAVYLSGYGLVHPSNRAALLGWLRRLADRQLVIFDPGPLVRSIPPSALRAVLARADWLTCNAAEASQLSGRAEPLAAITVLTGRAGRSAVLVRTGPQGCLLGRWSEEPVHVPGFRVRVRDTSGAGDTHTGAFLAALAYGATGVTAAHRANAAAAFSVTRHGPATAPTSDQLARFMARHQDEDPS